MEPLVVSGAQEHRPVFAAFHKGGRRIHIGLQVGSLKVTLLMHEGITNRLLRGGCA